MAWVLLLGINYTQLYQDIKKKKQSISGLRTKSGLNSETIPINNTNAISRKNVLYMIAR